MLWSPGHAAGKNSLDPKVTELKRLLQRSPRSTEAHSVAESVQVSGI